MAARMRSTAALAATVLLGSALALLATLARTTPGATALPAEGLVGVSSAPATSAAGSGTGLVVATAVRAGAWLVADGFAAVGTGTTGGAAGPTVRVTTLADLTRYASSSKPYVIDLRAHLTITGQIKVASDKTIVGGVAGAGLTGGGLQLKRVTNVIIAGLKIDRAVGTDAVTIWGSTHVFVTHNDLSSDRTHGKDHYDGLVDITQGSDDVTVSYNRFHDHYKVMLIGHSDKNAAVDTGRLHVTVHHNSFTNVGSRLPSLRFGTAQVYDNVFTNVDGSALHARMGGVILAQDNVFTNVTKPYVTHGDSPVDGRIVIDPGSAPSWPYRYRLDSRSAVAAIVAAQAGAS